MISKLAKPTVQIWTCDHRNEIFTVEKRLLNKKNDIEMESCPTSNLKYKRNKKITTN